MPNARENATASPLAIIESNGEVYFEKDGQNSHQGKWRHLQVYGTWDGASVTLEHSSNGTNWFTHRPETTGISEPVPSTDIQGIEFLSSSKFLRINVTGGGGSMKLYIGMPISLEHSSVN